MTRRFRDLEPMASPAVLAQIDAERPQTRADCKDGLRPCPFVLCRHHLYLDVNRSTGALKVNFPDIDFQDLADSCSLDVADKGGNTLEQVGNIMGLTRERIRQIEVRGLINLRHSEIDED